MTVREIVEKHIKEITNLNIRFIWGGECPWETHLSKFNDFLEILPAIDEGVHNGQLHIRLEGEEHDHNSPEWQEHLHDVWEWEQHKIHMKKYREKLKRENPEELKRQRKHETERRRARREKVKEDLFRIVDSWR